MSLLDRLFGKKLTASARDPLDVDVDGPDVEDDIAPADYSRPIDGPPAFVRVAEMQRAYWMPDDDERAELAARGVEQLDWRERLRLHHLVCMQRIGPEPARAAAAEACAQSARRLLANDSPYRPFAAGIWTRSAAQDADSEPDAQGMLLNLSVTHLGCLEVYRLDAAGQPTRVDFVGFDELSGIVFGPAKLIRAAKLMYDDGRSEMVYAPLLYGATWAVGTEIDRTGAMTRFVGHVDLAQTAAPQSLGVGVGQQDLCVRSGQDGGTMVGLGSVAEITFALDVHDPRFEEKARARGVDPDEVRRQMDGP